jgi:hypothetical protein
MEEVYESLLLDTVRWPDLQQCVCKVMCIVTSLFLAMCFTYSLEAEHLSHYSPICSLVECSMQCQEIKTCGHACVP